jgi:hypothetical protein
MILSGLVNDSQQNVDWGKEMNLKLQRSKIEKWLGASGSCL